MQTRNDLKVAIVDDDPDLPVLYSQVIGKLGYPSPSIFNNGTSIVKAMSRDHLSFDLIIMDYRMPEMNGVEAAKIIHRYRIHTKILIVSAYDFAKQQAFDAGFSFLLKPFSTQQLADSLDSLKSNLTDEAEFARP